MTKEEEDYRAWWLATRKEREFVTLEESRAFAATIADPDRGLMPMLYSLRNPDGSRTFFATWNE
jgi:hypothetical protein